MPSLVYFTGIGENSTEIPATGTIQYDDNSIDSLHTLLKDKSAPSALAEIVNNDTGGTGAIIYIANKQGKITALTNNFYLTSLAFSYKERAQLLENFNSANVSFFGDSAKVYQLQGLVLDYSSTNDDVGEYFHASSLIDMYDTVLRGTKLVESNSIAYLKVLNHTIQGYPLNLQVGYNAGSDKVAQFSMSLVVIEHTMTIPAVITKERLKNFYDVNSLKESKSYDEAILLLNSFLNPTVDISNITKLDKFLNIAGTANLSYILTKDAILTIPEIDDYINVLNGITDKVKNLELLKDKNFEVILQISKCNIKETAPVIMDIFKNLIRELTNKKIQKLYGRSKQ